MRAVQSLCHTRTHACARETHSSHLFGQISILPVDDTPLPQIQNRQLLAELQLKRGKFKKNYLLISNMNTLDARFVIIYCLFSLLLKLRGPGPVFAWMLTVSLHLLRRGLVRRLWMWFEKRSLLTTASGMKTNHKKKYIVVWSDNQGVVKGNDWTGEVAAAILRYQ